VGREARDNASKDFRTANGTRRGQRA